MLFYQLYISVLKLPFGTSLYLLFLCYSIFSCFMCVRLFIFEKISPKYCLRFCQLFSTSSGILWKRQLTSSSCKTHKHLFFLRTITSVCRSDDFYIYHFIIQNTKDTCTWMVRFNKISTFCCFTNDIKWNCYFLKLPTACQWRIWWLLIQNGATVLIHAKVSAVLPSIASVPSMQI